MINLVFISANVPKAHEAENVKTYMTEAYYSFISTDETHVCLFVSPVTKYYY